MKNVCVKLTLALLFSSWLAQGQTPAKPSAKEQDPMAQLLNYSRPGPSHAILASLAGTWTFQDKNLSFVKGTLVRKPIYEGRFFLVDITGGPLQIPIADGQMKLANYQGLEIEGYDNVKNSYITTSINNHIGSDTQQQMGHYDAQTRAFTYNWDSELRPGLEQKNRKILRIVDNDHYTEEYYELQNGSEKKYSRALAK